MKILKHTPETITVERNGSVLIYNLDEVRRKAVYDEVLMDVLREYLRFKIKEREK